MNASSVSPHDPTPLPSIIELASRPDVDPCDVACDAMPGFVLGDLTGLETSWVADHAQHCVYCQNVLQSYEDLDDAIDACGESVTRVTEGTAAPSTAAMLGLREAGYGFMESPVGPVVIVVTDTGVCDISYLGHRPLETVLGDVETRGIFATERQPVVAPVVEQLGEYFAHRRTRFFLPIDLHGVTPFTRSVLEATSAIDFGTVVSYGDLASAIGQPGASRAVGNALGRNPVPIVVPCHRVIKSDGRMGMYTGGTHIKEALLGVEGVRFATPHAVDQRRLNL